MANMVRVPTHRRKIKGKVRTVKGHSRKKRPKGKKSIIDKKPVKLYTIRDEFGRVKGFSKKPGK